MSNHYPKILLKMNTHLQSAFTYLENVVHHPAAGKAVAQKKKRRASAMPVIPKATPDSLNIRDMFKKQDSFRRNPAP
jgi:hypothetical protein